MCLGVFIAFSFESMRISNKRQFILELRAAKKKTDRRKIALILYLYIVVEFSDSQPRTIRGDFLEQISFRKILVCVINRWLKSLQQSFFD